MTDDPRPWLRCRCVSGLAWPDDYNTRCDAKPTAEDGLCDHCRLPDGACTDETHDHICCRSGRTAWRLVDLNTPCRAVADAEVPF